MFVVGPRREYPAAELVNRHVERPWLCLPQVQLVSEMPRGNEGVFRVSCQVNDTTLTRIEGLVQELVRDVGAKYPTPIICVGWACDHDRWLIGVRVNLSFQEGNQIMGVLEGESMFGGSIDYGVEKRFEPSGARFGKSSQDHICREWSEMVDDSIYWFDELRHMPKAS